MKSLSHLSSSALTDRLYQICKEERALRVEFVCCLAELDRRSTVLELGFPSLFAYCTDQLGLSKSKAWRMTTSARLLTRFPLVYDYLVDGRLSTTTLPELRDVLEEERLVEILDRASGRTLDQVKELVVALRPQPAQPDLLRRLPVRQPDSSGFTVKPVEELPGLGASAVPAAPPAPVAGSQPAARVQPIAPELHVLRVTVGAKFVADLEAVKQALSHKLPAGGLEEVLHECLRVTLEACKKRRRGAGKKTTAKAPPKDSRFIPAAVREAVWSRDAGQCTFVGANGRRCGSKYQVQVHHLHPFEKHGEATVENLTLYCRAHNQYAAVKDYGAEHMARRIAQSRSRAGEPKAPSARRPADGEIRGASGYRPRAADSRTARSPSLAALPEG